MSYTHTGEKPIVFQHDPIDPDSTDEVFFVLDNWLRADLSEVLTAGPHTATAIGATIVEQPRSVGPMVDSEGTTYQYVYAVRFSITAGATEVSITFRKSTTTTGLVDLGRTNHDHTIRIPVRSL